MTDSTTPGPTDAARHHREFESVTWITDEMPSGKASSGDTWASQKELAEWQDFATVYAYQGGHWWTKVGWISYERARAAGQAAQEAE